MKLKTDAVVNKILINPWPFLKSCLLILLMAYFLLKPPLNFIRLLGFSLRVDLWPIIPITGLLMYLIFRIPGRIGAIISTIAVLILFILPLIGMWSYGHSQTSVLSGLIQLNDARGYYIDALRLTIGEDFSYFSTRRPLFPGFLSFLLVITHQDLMTTLLILSVITAVSCYLMTREIQRTHGTETAVFLLIMVYLYYRLHSGNTMSENFGIAIGTLGFTVLWRGATDKNLWLISFGIFITTIALNARAGAFFVLPFLVIWTGWLFRESKLISWKGFLTACSAIVLGFACNFLLGRLIGQPDGIPFANFSYTLYSLAAGGKSWAYIAEVHPEVFLLPEPAHTKKVFELAFELMREKPLQSVQGALFFWKAIFTDTLYNVFSFVSKESWNLNPMIKWILYLLSLIGLFSWFRDKKSALLTLVVMSIVGIFLSVPLAPPTDSFHMRPYAASIATICILPSLGFGYLIKKIQLKFLDQQNITSSPTVFAVYFSALLIFITLGSPIFLKLTSSAAHINPLTCELNQESIVVYFAKGTYIDITKNTEEFADWPPDFHIYLFQKNLHDMADQNLIQWAETIKPNTLILNSLDIVSNKSLVLVLPTSLKPAGNGYVQFCGNFEGDPSLQAYSIFYASQSLPVALK